MSNEIYSDYFKNLLQKDKASKKQVAVYLDDLKLDRIDTITGLFSSISNSKSFTRNMLIEEAIDKYIEESKRFLLDEHDLDLDALVNEKYRQYDTVILSSNGRGFEDTFLGEGEDMCWYPCKISDSRRIHLRNIAIYRGEPISAITHYAVIKEIKYCPEKKCKVCYFDGEPKALSNKIVLGSKEGVFFRGAKYTELSSLLNAITVDDIVFG
jgi:hypothetical protein